MTGDIIKPFSLSHDLHINNTFKDMAWCNGDPDEVLEINVQ